MPAYINQPANPNVPGAYVNIIAPTVGLISSVQTNLIGVVGTATWGPVGAPMPFSTGPDFAAKFGPLQARKYDLGTAAAAAQAQGANNFLGVRVTDGTDVAATIVVQSTCITFTSKYTGSAANADTVTIATGTAASSFKITVQRPNYPPEVFDNITGSANAFWVNAANAINNGQSGLRGPSNYIVASAGVGTTAPTPATYTLTGGTDGTTTITGSVLVGLDTGTRKGMYGLRGTGPGILVLADCDDYTTFSSQIAFCLAEGFYGIGVGPSGEYSNLATVAANLVTNGSDTYAFKVLVGDWCYWLDTVNGGQRLISPQGFAAGALAQLGPEQSGLNKPVLGIIGTQKTTAAQTYSSADLAVIGAGRLDVISNNSPGGFYFSLRQGRNCSSNGAINGDNYSRLTPFLAYSLAGSAGQFVGQLQTAGQRVRAKSVIDAFFFAQWQTGRLGNAQGTQPYSVILDDSNNPPNAVQAGIERVDVKAQYASVIVDFIVNMEGGQTVQVATKLN